MINSVTLVGRLTKDPELKYTQSGIAVARFTVAANRPFSNSEGKREADFINCVAWRKQAENLAKYMTKGSLVGVVGRIQTSNFEGKDGNRVFMTEVVADSIQFLETKKASEQNNNSGYGRPPQETQQNQNDDPFNNSGGPMDISDDDLPF